VDSLIKQVYTNPIFGAERWLDFGDTFRNRIETFVQQVADGVAPEDINGSGADGLAAQKVLQAAIDSLDSGQVVDVD
jgi:predicted dehydrogenase